MKINRNKIKFIKYNKIINNNYLELKMNLCLNRNKTILI